MHPDRFGCPILENYTVTFYIDPQCGDDTADGRSPETPWKTWSRFTAEAIPGAALLLKKGYQYPLPLPIVGGTEAAPVSYGAYGEGALPVLVGDLRDVSREEDWVAVGDGVWRTRAEFVDACNLIFDDEVCGNMRYTVEELREDGEWCQVERAGPVYLRCGISPALRYRRMELVLFGHGVDLNTAAESHMCFRDLCFQKIGTHGITINDDSSNITILDCDLHWIGGAIFYGDPFSAHYGERFVERRVRYGNGIQLWSGVKNVLVKGCRIFDIYDGGFCIQGFENTVEHVMIEDNVLWNCGYDSLDIAHGVRTVDVTFQHNTCWNAGEGWALQELSRPRYSVLSPDNIGYHCNLENSMHWNDLSELVARRNIFCNAPESRCLNYGPHSVTSLIRIDENCYYQEDPNGLVAQIGETAFSIKNMDSYQKHTAWDVHSIVADPMFADPAAGDFRPARESPAVGYGARGREQKPHRGT